MLSINTNHTFALKSQAGEMTQEVRVLANELGSNIWSLQDSCKLSSNLCTHAGIHLHTHTHTYMPHTHTRTHTQISNKYFLKLDTGKSLEILLGKHFVVNISVSFLLL